MKTYATKQGKKEKRKKKKSLSLIYELHSTVNYKQN